MITVDEPFAAFFAGKWLLSCMSHQVFLEFGGMLSAQAADIFTRFLLLAHTA
jgi:hypothetical protein